MIRRSWLFILIVLFALGCGSGQQPPGRGENPAGKVESGIIVGLQGEAAMKRAGWRDYAPAMFGAAFRRGDLLRLTAGRAVVACADLRLATVEAGVSGFPCQASQRPAIVFEGALLNPTRGDGAGDEFPRVISPRKTRLLNPRPLFRWQPVAAAKSYKVRLQGASWTAEAAGDALAYPDNAPALQPGVAYRLVVTAGDRSSNEEEGSGLGFSIIPADEARAVRDAEARIRGLGLTETPTALLIANVYATHGLYAEAIEGLERLREAQEPAVLRLLGDLYLSVGLNRQAEERYLAALAGSALAADLEGQAQAHHALGRIYDALGDRAAARRSLTDALARYERLGDASQAAEVKRILSAVEGTQPDAPPKP
ncbi:MAG: tetratricopeptide repeat protein [Chloroflexi bacterium]|nr:tetratricopeptide repeat protein [Chloroflexota bacterium]